MTRISSMPVALVLSAFLLGVSAGSSKAVEVADLPSASGGTQHVWYDAPAKPTAVAIMFIGGDGVVPFEADGSLKGGRSTLVRTRQLWLDRGIAVLIPGKPSSLAGAFSYRLTDSYAQDIRALVEFAHAHASVPVWLFGHSLGTVAVASGASRLTHGEIAGVVFASPVANHFPPNLTEAVFDAPLAVINVPALIVAHAQDSCSTTAPDGPARLRAVLTGSPKSDILLFNGGEPSGGPCDPTALHSFVGLDAEFVERVTAWMHGALVAAPTPLQATDVAWHAASTLKDESQTDEGPRWKREGTAIFKTGERASLVSNGTSDALSEIGVRTYKAQYLLRFDDGSTITIQGAGRTDLTTGRGAGSGEFVNGTGRFEGISGKVTFFGRASGEVSEGDWVGSYTLPAK